MSSPDKLLALINADNPHNPPLTFDSVALSNPAVDVGDAWNTKVTVSSVPGHGYFGDVDVFYTRPGLSVLGSNVGLLSEQPFTADSIVSLLSAKRQADVTLSDLDVFTVPHLTVLGEMQSVVLVAKSDSLGWTGATEVALLFGLPPRVDLLHQLVTQIMPAAGYL